jgi:hypothetical protein
MMVVGGVSYASNILEITGWKLGRYDQRRGCLVVFHSPSGQMPVYYLKLGHDRCLSHIPQFIIL